MMSGLSETHLPLTFLMRRRPLRRGKPHAPTGSIPEKSDRAYGIGPLRNPIGGRQERRNGTLFRDIRTEYGTDDGGRTVLRLSLIHI